MKIVLWPLVALLFVSCTSQQAEKEEPRKPSSLASCKSILQGVVVGYEVDDYGRSEKIETVDEITKDWSGTEFEFSVIPMKVYKKHAVKGKQNLELEFEIFAQGGKSTLSKSYKKWEKWPAQSKKGEPSYMKLKGFSLRRIFGRLVHPLYEEFNEARVTKKKKKIKQDHLPRKISMRLVDKAKKKVVCEHIIKLDQDYH